MKYTFFLVLLIALSGCHTSRQIGQSTSVIRARGYFEPEPPLTQSLFSDKASSISEENIQKILDGNYALPDNLRVAIVKLENNQYHRNYYWNDEQFLKSQQEYMDLFTDKFKQSEGFKRCQIFRKIGRAHV